MGVAVDLALLTTELSTEHGVPVSFCLAWSFAKGAALEVVKGEAAAKVARAAAARVSEGTFMAAEDLERGKREAG